jgi:uncharacterized membrane protein YebE (DUF533 family)
MLDTKALLDRLLSAGASGEVLTRSEDTPLPHAAARRHHDPDAGPRGLVGLVLGAGTGRRLGETAQRIGGLALIGGLAHLAWINWKAGAVPEDTMIPSDPADLPPPATSPFAQAEVATRADQASLVLIRAMIAGAKANGRIDGNDAERMRAVLATSHIPHGAENFLIEAAEREDGEELAEEAFSPEFGAEIWLAARLAIALDHQSERDFLDAFARQLKLDTGLVPHLEAVAVAAKDDRPTV